MKVRMEVLVHATDEYIISLLEQCTTTREISTKALPAIDRYAIDCTYLNTYRDHISRWIIIKQIEFIKRFGKSQLVMFSHKIKIIIMKRPKIVKHSLIFCSGSGDA